MNRGLVISCGVALIFNLLVFCTFLICSCEVDLSGQLLASDDPEVLEISADEAAERVVDGLFDVILDVRQPGEYEETHILGALLIPLNTLKEKAPEKLGDPSVSILTYCGVGARSLEAVKILRALGYKDTVSLKGGIVTWEEKGYPVAK